MRVLERELGSLVVHASAPTGALTRVVLWLGGTPHTGALLEPVVAAAAAVGRDVISIARPGYGGSPRREGRRVADAADDAAQVLDLLDLNDVVVVGFSGGGPHALATAAACPQRTGAVLTFGCIAPFCAVDDWFSGMADPSALQASARGLAVRAAHPDTWEPSSFIHADHDALDGQWRDLVTDTQGADRYGPGGAIDDDMAFVRSWGFPIDQCVAPTTIVHGASDRVVPMRHASAIATLLPNAATVIHRDEGHVSVLRTLGPHFVEIASHHR